LPIIIPNSDAAKKISRRAWGQSITELESLMASSDTSPLQMPLPQTLYQNLCNALDDPPAEIVSIAPPTALVGILETVRMVILNWTLKLEEDGILGEGLSFSSSEKQTASEHTYNRVVPQ
jgi:AbiTii